MLNKIIQFSLKNRLAILIAAVLLLIGGSYTAATMEVDVFPDLNAPTVVVMTEAQGMAPEEVEQLVTFPVETAVNGATDVRRVRSSSTTGFSVVWVEFNWGTDIYRARQIVSEKLAVVGETLPANVGKPVLGPQSSILGEVLFLGLSADTTSLLDLRTLADWAIRPRLLSTGGVAQVTVLGGDIKEYQILLHPERMRHYAVSLADVMDVTSLMNQNASGGVLYEYGNEYIIRGVVSTNDAEALGKTVVKRVGTVPVLLENIADVKMGGKTPKMGLASINGKQGVLLTVTKQPNTSTLALTEQLDASIEEIQKSLPADVKIRTDLYRQQRFIDSSISNIQKSLLEGGIFVVLILFIFLMNVRTTLISLVTIPLALLVTILTLKVMGLTINTMSIGGMAIAIGSLVDDAIVDVENVFKRLRENRLLPRDKQMSVLNVVFHASKEVRMPILNSTLIIVVSFIPLFFLSGMEGRMLAPLGVSFIVSLFASTLVALTLTPVLCSYLLRKKGDVDTNAASMVDADASMPNTANTAASKANTASMVDSDASKANIAASMPNTDAEVAERLSHAETVSEKEPFIVRHLKRLYEKCLLWTLAHKKSVLTGLGVVLVATLVIFANLGRSFLPPFNEGSFTINVSTMPGVSLEESDRIGQQAEAILLTIPEIQAVARKTGRAELDEHALGVNTSEIEAPFVLGNRSKDEVLAELRRKMQVLSGVNIEIGQPISHRIDAMLSGTQANIAIKLFGPDLNKLYSLGQQIKSSIGSIEGIADLNVEQQIERPQLKIEPKRELLAKYGITLPEFTSAINVLLEGEVVSQVFEGNRSFDLTVKVDDESRSSMDRIGNLLIDTGDGQKIPLEYVATITSTAGPNTINRENVSRKLVVSANVAGRDVRSAVNEIQQVIDADISFPEGYHVEYGGQFESEQAASRTLMITSLFSILVIFLLLYSQFKDTKQAAVVLLNLPLALIGGVLALFFTSGVMSIPAIIGFISLFGIATRNGMLLIDRYNELRKEGFTAFESVMHGSLDRLNPIIMTALTSALALIPLALGGELPGNEIQSPMAKVMLGGLLTSTLLNAFIIPIMYMLMNGKKTTAE